MKYPKLVEKIKLLHTYDGPMISEGEFTDDEIDYQISIVMESTMTSDLDSLVNKFIDADLKISDIPTFLNRELNRPDDYKPNKSFWKNSGSVLLLKRYFDKRVPESALAWEDVFKENVRENFFNQRDWEFKMEQEVNKLRGLIKKRKRLKPSGPYMYSTAKQYEKAINNAKATIENNAMSFCLDPNNNIEERIKLFEVVGGSDGWIFRPDDKVLAKMFESYYDADYCSKHEEVYCSNVLEYAIEQLEYESQSGEVYPRNYEITDALRARLKTMYFNKLVIEGVASFKFDW